MKPAQTHMESMGPHPWPRAVARCTTAPDRSLLAHLQRPLDPVSIRLDLWNGTTLYGSPARPIATVTIQDRGMLFGLFLQRELMFGEGVRTGRIAVAGDLVELLEAVYRTFPPRAAGWLSRMATWRRNTLGRSRHDIHQHYDLGNDFYRLWLDAEMLYTCAYFPQPGMSLEEAQIAKM